ncbi:hypothetical protein [Thiomonas sp. FB-6]|uniref:hypothetical protein n=1 Tax=Thiomonas sp. FB-6 TaxID=1158291 RepID=UPI0012DC0435|nr:hypothetical protein [Thiomonas sp. FB-6]
MSRTPDQSPLVRTKSQVVVLLLALLGLVLIIIGNAVNFTYWDINFGQTIASVGALFLVIGVLQWFFDRYVRASFFSEIREEIVGNSRVAQSGIADFYIDSKSVVFNEFFATSSQITIGVNYSSKLIDNCIDLLRSRTENKKRTTIVAVKSGGDAAKFLIKDYSSADVEGGLRKIRELVAHIDANHADPSRRLIEILEVDTILRYSFVKFDGRIWIVIGTNGLGRRAVPGFFVSNGTPWFDHFEKDILMLLQRT